MEYKQKIIACINRLYVDAIGEFREAEARIARDSKFRSIFRKKDYSGNIEMLKGCRKTAMDIRFPAEEIPEEDRDSREILQTAEETIRHFIKLCDSHIRMQTALEKKSRGEELSLSDYKEIYQKTEENLSRVNQAIGSLDILYADYVEAIDDPGEEGTEYMTYDMLVGDKERP